MTIDDKYLQDSEYILTEIYSNFEPFDLPPEGTYVDCEKVRGGWEITRELGRKITRSRKPTCQIYSGHRGVGKSTELKRLQEFLKQRRYTVVYFAVDEEDIEPQDAEYADILFACTRHLVEAVRLEKGHNPLVQWMQDKWSEMQDLALMNVTFESLSLEQQVGLFQKISTTFKAVPDKRREMRRKINANTPSLVDALNGFIKAAEAELKKRIPDNRGLVVIVDNLDRIVEIREGENQPSNYDEIFLNRCEMLRGLDCHMIYTTPISMIYSERATELEDRFDTPNVLPMVMVRWRNNTINPEGLSTMKTMITKRVHQVHPKLVQTLEGAVVGVNVPAVFDCPKSVERLCVMSGGHVRNLMQLVQKAIDWTDTLPITEKAVNRAIADVRRTYLQAIQEKHWPLLATAHEQRDYQRTPDYLRLFLNRCLLEYRYYDEVTETSINWCDVHPLIEDIPRFQQELEKLKKLESSKDQPEVAELTNKNPKN